MLTLECWRGWGSTGQQEGRGHGHLGSRWQFLTKHTSHNNSTPSSRGMETHVHTKTWTRVFIMASFVTAKNWRQPRCPSVEQNGSSNKKQLLIRLYAVWFHSLDICKMTNLYEMGSMAIVETRPAQHEGTFWVLTGAVVTQTYTCAETQSHSPQRQKQKQQKKNKGKKHLEGREKNKKWFTDSLNKHCLGIWVQIFNHLGKENWESIKDTQVWVFLPQDLCSGGLVHKCVHHSSCSLRREGVKNAKKPGKWEVRHTLCSSKLTYINKVCYSISYV